MAKGSGKGKRRIMVRVNNAADVSSVESVLTDHALQVSDSIDALGVRIIEVDEDLADAAYQDICSRCRSSYAELDAIATPDFIPNDPYVADNTQWYLDSINTYEGWDITTGSSDVVIAVLDSGVNAQHPDLVGKVLTGQGYDFVNNDADASDDQGHGTSVAGTAAANVNNGIGIAGIAMNAKILPVKVMSAASSALYSNIAKGIIYAADNGADIINVSLTGTVASTILQDAVNYAWGKGCVVVCSAGNSGLNEKLYPAACNNVIAVSASNYWGEAPSWSTKGDHVDVVAPGHGIQTTTMNGGYGMTGGTSFSAPIVSGLAALLMSSPLDLSNAEIEDVIKNTATDIGAVGKDDASGFGIINVEQALTEVFPMESAPVYNIIPEEHYVTITEVNGDTVTLSLYATEGMTLTVQCSSDLQNWVDAQAVVATGAPQSVTLTGLAEDCLFIRAALPE